MSGRVERSVYRQILRRVVAFDKNASFKLLASVQADSVLSAYADAGVESAAFRQFRSLIESVLNSGANTRYYQPPPPPSISCWADIVKREFRDTSKDSSMQLDVAFMALKLVNETYAHKDLLSTLTPAAEAPEEGKQVRVIRRGDTVGVGDVLIAHPVLRVFNFASGLLVVTVNDVAGAEALSVNTKQPFGFIGGPLSLDRTLNVVAKEEIPNSVQLADSGLWMTKGVKDTAKFDKLGVPFRAMLGFAAWHAAAQPGEEGAATEDKEAQLEREIREGTWFPAKVPAELMIPEGQSEGFQQYIQVLKGMGGEYAHFATMKPDWADRFFGEESMEEEMVPLEPWWADEEDDDSEDDDSDDDSVVDDDDDDKAKR